jgi:hypothetical protein
LKLLWFEDIQYEKRKTSGEYPAVSFQNEDWCGAADCSVDTEND